MSFERLLFALFTFCSTWIFDFEDSYNPTEPGVDTSCFPHRFTDFGHTNLGVPKFNFKLK